MSQTIRTKKTNDENEKLNEFLAHIEEKYNISKEQILGLIDQAKTQYELQKYNISLESIDDEIDAINMNEQTEITTVDTVNEGLKKAIERAIKEYEENNKSSNKISKNNNTKLGTDNKNLLQKSSSSINNGTAKKYNIPKNSKIDVKYNTTIIYNLGDNLMEKQFNTENPYLNEKELQSIDTYDLLPKDFNGQKDGYEKYFSDIKDKLLLENKENLRGLSSFFLFVAFDVIDAKPTFEDLIGIDPLNDYKKYILKIDLNNKNLFLVSGQIIYIEGRLIEDEKTIEIINFKNGFDIAEYSINYEQIKYFYEKSSDPYALYTMNGPYFSKDNIDLTVFNSVIKQVAAKNPHYFIINGPFFSTENEKVKWGECDTEQGMKEIIDLLKNEFNNTRTKILICPGISDNENFYPVPQPPFDKINDDLLYMNKKGAGGSEIIFISNPQIIQINEALLGVANFDVIKDIIFNSIHSQEINTVDKACEMILYQKNFYPVLPNTIQQSYENNQEKIVTVDLSQYEYLRIDKYESSPDIILTNSAMKTFAKKIHGTVFVNCGSFIKGKNFGEIAKITLHDPSKDTDVNKRLKVEFIKINAINNSNNSKN